MSQRFPETRWSLVRKVIAELKQNKQDAENSSAKPAGRSLDTSALAEFVRIYSPAIESYFRFLSDDEHAAENFSQAFLAEKILGGSMLEKVNEELGGLRPFLKKCLRNFFYSERQKENRHKRGGTVPHLTLDHEPRHGETAERNFDKVWARTIVQQATERIESKMREKGQQRRFDLFRAFITSEPDALSMAQMAGELNLSTNSMKTFLLRFRKEYGKALREVIAETLDSADDDLIDAEMRDLFRAFS